MSKMCGEWLLVNYGVLWVGVNPFYRTYDPGSTDEKA